MTYKSTRLRNYEKMLRVSTSVCTINKFRENAQRNVTERKLLFLYYVALHFCKICLRHFGKFREIPKFREIVKTIGKFSPGKFREIFPRIFRDFQGMKHMLQR